MREKMRVDKFLKVSRLIKRRTVANQVCESDRVLINQKPVKPSYQVKKGDILEIVQDKFTVKVKILDVKDNVKKEEASSLYEIL